VQENLKGIPVRQYGKNLKHLPFIYFSVFITPFRLKVIAHSSGAPGFTPGISGVRVTRSLVLCVCFVDRCLSFFFWPLRCLSFFDLRILITPLVSSNSSECHRYLTNLYEHITSLLEFT
jgi:hypothetical protein